MEKNNKIANIHITYQEFKKMRTIFLSNDLDLFLIPPVTWIFFSLFALSPTEEKVASTLGKIIVSDICLILLWIAVACWYITIRTYQDYKKIVKNNPESLSYSLEFSEKYLIKKTEKITEKILYRDIKKWKEIDDTLYIETSDRIKVLIPVAKVDSKIISEIKEIDFSKKMNMKNKKIVKNNQFAKKEGNMISHMLTLIFFLTLFTPWIALGGWFFLAQLKSTMDFDMFQYAYGAFVALPIPLLSLILGFCYKKKNASAKRNIIIGAIMCLVVIFFASFSLISSLFGFETDYSEVQKYQEVIGIELPSVGKFRKVKWDESYLSEHISSTVTFQDKEESDKFYREINSSKKWISEDKISTNLENLMPIDMICSKKSKCRYLIYNKELNTYNEVPTESGKYHFQSMMYDDTKRVLKIEEFSYQYKS